MKQLLILKLILLTVSLGQDINQVTFDSIFSEEEKILIGSHKLTAQEKEKLKDYIVQFYLLGYEKGKDEISGLDSRFSSSPPNKTSKTNNSFEQLSAKAGDLSNDPRFSQDHNSSISLQGQVGGQLDSREETKITKRQYPTPTQSTPSSELVESKIDGDFEGWDGETIIKLFNGQIWQQTEYYYHYHYSFMPSVTIYKSGSSYKMKVDGVDKAVRVKRLK